jgi:hypothetical protein
MGHYSLQRIKINARKFLPGVESSQTSIHIVVFSEAALVSKRKAE